MGCTNSQAKQTTTPRTATIAKAGQSQAAQPQADITLEYFGIYGRAEPLRMLLTHAKVPFNDKRYAFPDDGSWAKRKADGQASGELQFGGMPIVSVKGHTMQQMVAILRAMGIKHGYYNVSDPKECYRADFLIECYADAQFGVLAKAAFNPDFQDAEKRGPIMENCVEKGFCGFFG
jgi:hypothetical protein